MPSWRPTPAVPQQPARVKPPKIPPEPDSPSPNRYLWTCRAGFEGHLFEELAWLGAHPKMIGPALVESDARKNLRPAFGRAGFKVLWAGRQLPTAEACAERLAAAAGRARVHVQGWAVDEPSSLPRSSAVEAMAEQIASALRERATQKPEGVLGQLVVAGPALWILGLVPRDEAASVAAGGRQRMRRGADAPSRASMKLEEALTELGLEPSRGEECVDLGAAPGGWTRRLIERGAKVIAVDPANLAPELASHPKVRHVKQSAFAFEPDEPVDWLFCDMAWRPLEVAQLLAKWARRGWALHLVANIKLPMKDKNPILLRVRRTLEEGGWKNLTVRQLYHDRDEVTVTARRAG